VHGVDIGFGIDSHGSYTDFAASTNDTKGYFTSVGYKNFFEHNIGLEPQELI
jgi:hypothetical protein